jgi:RNA polymerase sigma-70 factor (ECF subfamily)
MADDKEQAAGAPLTLEGAAPARDEKEDRRFEEECIMKCHDGDREAFRPLVERYSKSLYIFAHRIVGSEEDAKEITQEAFTRAYNNLVDFKFRFRFSTWLFAIALNLCRDHLKQAKKKRAFAGFDRSAGDIAAVDPIEQRIDARRRCQRLMSCVRLLPPRHREAIVMKDVMGLSYRQMQKNLRLPIPLLKVRVMRARRKLCSLMNET